MRRGGVRRGVRGGGRVRRGGVSEEGRGEEGKG